ncbi:ADP-ribosylglycohydrolase [Treponema ruminis]|nr:ADP-ribosylglycohydrolase family protein [Treponema ruminis]QSI02206.1 ADP-ribosylglycohydrolase [Treponema ruminis]
MKEKIRNTLYGAIVADALGVPVEFKDRGYLKKNPITDMIGYETYNLPKGSWSDDSSMTLCLAESIGRLKGIDYEDVMKNFVSWFDKGKFTPDGKLFDIGMACRKSIVNFMDKTPALECGQKSEWDNGNGSLMRISPLPLYLYQKFGSDAMSKEEAFELIHNVSRLTHGHKISLIGCDIYCAVMIEILNGAKKEELLQKALPKIGDYVRHNPLYTPALAKYDRITHMSFARLSEDKIKSSGYVVDTLEAALWCFLTTENYRDCVLKAVNLGSDTDTVACVAGSISGLYYGGIPTDWIEAIRNRKLVNKVIDKFTNVIFEEK